MNSALDNHGIVVLFGFSFELSTKDLTMDENIQSKANDERTRIVEVQQIAPIPSLNHLMLPREEGPYFNVP